MNFDPNRDPDSPEENEELENADEMESEDGRFLEEEEAEADLDDGGADAAVEPEETMSEAIEEDLPSVGEMPPPDPYEDGPPMPPRATTG